MTESVVAEVRDRITPPGIVGTAVVAAVFYGLGHGETAIALFVGVVIGVPIVGAVFDGVRLGRTTAGVAFGSFVAVAGAMAVLDNGSWFGAVFLAAGTWIVLDTLFDYRHGEPAGAEPEAGDEEEDISTAEMHTLGAHGRWVLETLREADRPLTAEEIRSRAGLTADEFSDVLEILEGNGTVEPVGNGYVIDESAMGMSGFVRSVGGRLLRPVRLFRPSG